MKHHTQKTVLIIVIALFACNLSLAQKSKDKVKEFHMDENYEIGKNGSLHLNVSDAKVNIIGSNRSDAHVKIDRKEVIREFHSSSREFEMDIKTKGDDLYVEEYKKGSISIKIAGYHKLDYSILVELPQGVSLIAKSDDSFYFIENVNGIIEVNLDDGDIDLKNCNGSSFDFNLDDGNLLMDGGKGKLYAKMDDGSVYNEPTPTQGYGVSMGNNLMIDSRVGVPGQGN